MKGKYKRKMIWCSKCDANRVEVGTKCLSCGHREYAQKIKKPKIRGFEILTNGKI